MKKILTGIALAFGLSFLAGCVVYDGPAYGPAYSYGYAYPSYSYAYPYAYAYRPYRPYAYGYGYYSPYRYRRY